MRIANPEAIRKGERALAEAIASNFDRGIIRNIFKKVHNLDVGDDIQCKNTALGVHGDEVAYSMDFEVLVHLSILLDRRGNFISISSSGVAPESSARNEEAPSDKGHAPEADTRRPENLETGENGVFSGEGGYEAVLKEFVPLDSEFQESNL